MSDFESQEDEVEALQSIFTEEEFYSVKEDKSIRGQFNAFVSVPEGYTVFYRKIELPEAGSSSDGNNKETKDCVESKIFEKTVTVQYLPPVQLSFNLPHNYPSDSPPLYNISCPWLTFDQLKKLSKQLYKIWNENKGFVVLYSWAQFLKDECLPFLQLEKSLDVAAVEAAYKISTSKMFSRMKKPEENREALTNISNKLEENAVGEVIEENCKVKEEVCTVVDLSSISDKIKEEQARLVKLTLYESSEESDAQKVKRSLYEKSGPSEEVVVDKMIAFDQDQEVKRSLYCSGTSENPVSDVKQVPRKDLVRAGPSNRKSQYRRHYAKEKRFRNKPSKSRSSLPVKSVMLTPLTEPLWNIIVEYNKMRRKKDFDYQMFCCVVCFEEKIGSQCMELDTCNHVFCRECLSSFLSVCITEGKVKQLSCPETDCDSELLQSEIKSLVSPELFSKYDSLLLATTLDTLNVTYCPRKFCQYPVSSDNETMAVCPQCDYCFCPFCKTVYHGVEPCRFKLDSEESKALIKEYQNCSDSRKAELEKRYGRKHLQQLVDTSLSQSWISSNSKPCPKCNSSIERIYGCNKMVCLRCNTAFCWLCFEILEPVDPYRHFQAGRCAGKLYLGMTVEDEDEMDELDVEDDFDEDDDFLDDVNVQFFGENVGIHHFHNGIFYL